MLGDEFAGRAITTVSDLDGALSFGFHTVVSVTVGDLVSSYGVLLVFPANYYLLQIFASTTGAFKKRIRTEGNWSTWT